ncbi:MAG: hypothetical protein H0V19_04660 [Euzebyales bacterium]|nr:hypothetical protein [Euzebyales bacterium]
MRQERKQPGSRKRASRPEPEPLVRRDPRRHLPPLPADTDDLVDRLDLLLAESADGHRS